MANYYGDAVVVTGKYQKDGQEKSRFTKIGACFMDDKNNISIKLDVLPMPIPGKDGFPEVWVKIFKKERDDVAF